jgi:hypothetical protein
MKFAHNSVGPYTRTIIMANSEYQVGLNADSRAPSATAIRSWVRWLASVLCTSMFISYIANGGSRVVVPIETELHATSGRNALTQFFD